MRCWQWKLGVVLCVLTSTAGLLGQAATPQQKNSTEQGAKPVAGNSAGEQHGTVLFSRSVEDAAKNRTAAQTKEASANIQASDEERTAPTFLVYDLDVRLMPKQESLAVRAQVTIRNDGDKPLNHIAMQLSSMLHWEQVRTAGKELQFAQHSVDSDADHTGAVNEAVIALPQALDPKAELKLDVLYSGQVPLTAKRLERIGAPADVAEHSDWDRISLEFTGLRGFGNVVWYPVSAAPAMLGDGAKLFAEMGSQKLRQSQARVSMRVTEEFFPGPEGAPNVAVLDGQVVPVTQTAAPEASFPGVVTCSLPETVLGFASPSLFLTTRKEIDGNGLRIFAREGDEANAQGYETAATLATPLVQQWLRPRPMTALTVADLPEQADDAAEEGAVFFAGMKSAEPQALAPAVVHSLAHAYFRSPREWLNEGVAQFLGILWMEQTQGRQAALERLNAARGALALAEPGTPGEAGGQELIHASDEIYYGTKATYVLWMLRDLAGDSALAAALKSYVPEDDTAPEYFERLLEKSSGKDLRWFFDAWVYHDRGLPDLSVAGVFPSRSSVAGQYLVAIDISNDGYAEAEVPVTVRSDATTITERLRVPARGKVSHRMLIQGLPTEIQVNDGTVPEVQASVHRQNLTLEK